MVKMIDREKLSFFANIASIQAEIYHYSLKSEVAKTTDVIVICQTSKTSNGKTF